MKRSDIALLFQYNEWANLRILDRALSLDTRQVRAEATVSHGSLFGTLVHIFGAESVWRTRCQERVSPTRMPSNSDFADLRSLEVRWVTEMGLMRSYVAQLDSRELSSRIEYANTSGKLFSTPLWQILLHVVNHGTQFRSEAGIVLTESGASPGDMDLIAFLRSVKDVQW